MDHTVLRCYITTVVIDTIVSVETSYVVGVEVIVGPDTFPCNTRPVYIVDNGIPEMKSTMESPNTDTHLYVRRGTTMNTDNDTIAQRMSAAAVGPGLEIYDRSSSCRGKSPFEL
jgi:hypothetical protein